MTMGPIAMTGTPTKEGNLVRETQRRHTWTTPCDSGGRNWSGASTNQGTPKMAGHHRKPGRGSKDPPRETLQRTWPSQQLDFIHLASRNVREDISSVLTPTVLAKMLHQANICCGPEERQHGLALSLWVIEILGWPKKFIQGNMEKPKGTFWSTQ